MQNHPVSSGLVVRRPISASPAGLNFNPGFFSLLLLFLMVVLLGQFSFFFYDYPITKLLTKLNSLFKLLYLNSNFALTLVSPNPALNKQPSCDWKAIIQYAAQAGRFSKEKRNLKCERESARKQTKRDFRYFSVIQMKSDFRSARIIVTLILSSCLR